MLHLRSRADHALPGLAELRAARRAQRGLFWAAGLFSLFGNLLMLTGPLFMMQVYDRVLGSRSVETLAALCVLGAGLYLVMGVLEHARGRLLARIGAGVSKRLEARVFAAEMAGPPRAQGQVRAGLRELEALRRLLASPAVTAVFDMPFTPIFVLGLWIFSPWMALLALVGGAALIGITLANQLLTQHIQACDYGARIAADQLAEHLRTAPEVIQAMGMQDSAFLRWRAANDDALSAQLRGGDLTGGLAAAGRVLRLILQSGMLALGALLVLRQDLTGGALIAGSILMGRALAPVEVLLAHWPMVQAGRHGWQRLAALLAEVPAPQPRTPLPAPAARLEVARATIVVPGERIAALRMINFTVEPGQAVGVIGPSGAGKSTLARAITGLWPVAGGSIRLDSAALDQYDPAALGRHVGYLPQRVQLLEGTIAENIARLTPAPDAAQVVAAARLADAHEMILKLPEGYDTRITAADTRLSGGQLQRLGLARALYGDPVLLVLDEPNSNLDNEGSEALNAAIRAKKAAGHAVLIMAHRPAAIRECDLLLMLSDGTQAAFGPRDEILRRMVSNHEDIARSRGMGGVR